jgi:L-alanine-DL-glutamate epimerase-like enolase superfamily enzyme
VGGVRVRAGFGLGAGAGRAAGGSCTDPSITEDYDYDNIFLEIAKALAASDPGRAERIAQSITNAYLKASALTNLARAAVLHAADDPEAVRPERGR